MPSHNARLVLEALLAELYPGAVFERLREAGVEPHVTMDVIARLDALSRGSEADVLREKWGDFDWIPALVESYGLEEATRIARRTSHWASVDVARHAAAASARLRVRAAIVDEVPVSDAYALFTEVDERDRAGLLARLARVYPLEELAYLDALSDADARAMGAVLAACVAPLAAFDELVGEVEDERVVGALRRFWGVDAPGIVELAARLFVDAGRPVTSVVPLAEARLEPSAWLPMLRPHGLKASLAMLRLLEGGRAPLEIARLLAGAGYRDDEVLAALLENGLGASASLELLRTHGFSVERMVAALAQRGVLVTEVRDHLGQLGVPMAAQRTLLAAHWEPAVLDLVLPRPTRLRLGSGD